MKKLLRNSLIASVVAVAGVVSGAGASFAGSAELKLNGNIPASCEFDQSNYSNSEISTTKTKDNIDTSIYWEGTFTVSCNHGGKVNITVDSVTESEQVAAIRKGSSLYGEYFEVFDSSIYQKLWANGLLSSVTPSPQPYNTGLLNYLFVLQVEPAAAGQTGIVAGDYGYTIQMTATPN